MAHKTDIINVLNSNGNGSLIDVRSPNEFERGHIPGALHIPVFDNEERAQVGIKYKQSGRRQAT